MAFEIEVQVAVRDGVPVSRNDAALLPMSAITTPSVHSKFQTWQGAKKAEQTEHATNDSNITKLTPKGASISKAL